MTYRITLTPSHQSFPANADETVLAAGQRAGIALPYGCRNGLCGMCKAKLLAGHIDYCGEPAGLTAAERAAGWILCCQAQPREDLSLSIDLSSATAPISPRRMPARVESIARLNHDVLQLILKVPDSIRFAFLAGQYIDFILADGRHRSFSVANAPQQDSRIELHIRHIDGGRFTGELFDHLQQNDILRIEGPLGNFYLHDTSARPVILMAGGTGFAPVKSMIEDMIARGIPRQIYFYWGARAREDLYQHELALGWAKRFANIRYVPVLSHPKPDDPWQGRTGYVHVAVAHDFPDLSGYEVYGSGPPAMVYAGQDVFLKQGLPREQYFSDAFEFAND
jgi:CDP-4-dehydro-6-deoxyglucose reductase, E3